MFCQNCGKEIAGNERYCEQCKVQLFGQPMQTVQQQDFQEMVATEQYVNMEQYVPVTQKPEKGTNKVKSGIILVSAVAVAAGAGWGIGKVTAKPEYIQVAVEGETVKIDSEDYQKVCDEKESLVLQVDEISKSQEELEGKIDSLTEQNAQLAAEKIEVLQEKESLATDINKLQESQANILYSQLDVTKDGMIVSSNEEGFVTIDGKEYIAYSTLEFITDEKLNHADNNLYVGNITGEKVYLMDVCPPYDSSVKYATDLIKSNGNTYSNGIRTTSKSQYLLFNLNGEYSNFEFDLGHIDGTDMVDVVIYIYLDEKLVKTIEQKPDAVVTHQNISLNYAKHMKVEIVMNAWGCEYGLAEMKLTY